MDKSKDFNESSSVLFVYEAIKEIENLNKCLSEAKNQVIELCDVSGIPKPNASLRRYEQALKGKL